MDNIKIIVLIIIILLIILFITIVSDTCSIESLENIPENGIKQNEIKQNDINRQETDKKINFDIEYFIKSNSDVSNNFKLASSNLIYTVLKDPTSVSVSGDNKYLIYNSNKNNILLVGETDISGTNKIEKVFSIMIFNNIFIATDASGHNDPNFTVKSYIIKHIDTPQFVFNNGNLIIKSVDSSGNNVIINETNDISGPNTALRIDDNGLNSMNLNTMNKKQIISYEDLQKKLRPCYVPTHKINSKQIIGLMVFALQIYKP
jgi:hypothetical protein